MIDLSTFLVDVQHTSEVSRRKMSAILHDGRYRVLLGTRPVSQKYLKSTSTPLQGSRHLDCRYHRGPEVNWSGS